MPFGWGKGHQRVSLRRADSPAARGANPASPIQCNFTIPDNEPLGQPVGLQRDPSIDKGSIAARNGKLQVGDTLVSVSGMATEGKEVAMITDMGRNIEFVAMRKDARARASSAAAGVLEERGCRRAEVGSAAARGVTYRPICELYSAASEGVSCARNARFYVCVECTKRVDTKLV